MKKTKFQFFFNFQNFYRYEKFWKKKRDKVSAHFKQCFEISFFLSSKKNLFGICFSKAIIVGKIPESGRLL